jgi:hypothetical protein
MEHVETFKEIPGWEGCYKATLSGHIYSIKTEELLKGTPDKDGYIRHHFRNNPASKTVAAHRMVAITFLENPLNLPQINHKNGIKDDNRVENLEWISNIDNQRHSWEQLGRKPYPNRVRLIGKNNPVSTPVMQCDEFWNPIQKWESANLAGKALGIDNSGISKACKDSSKTPGGFKFRYLQDGE